MSSVRTQTTTTATIASVRRFIDNPFRQSSFGLLRLREAKDAGFVNGRACATYEPMGGGLESKFAAAGQSHPVEFVATAACSRSLSVGQPSYTLWWPYIKR